MLKLNDTSDDVMDKEDQQREKQAQVFERQNQTPFIGPIGQPMVVPRTTGPAQGPMSLPGSGSPAPENLNQTPFPAVGPAGPSIAAAIQSGSSGVAAPRGQMAPNAPPPTGGQPAMAVPGGSPAGGTAMPGAAAGANGAAMQTPKPPAPPMESIGARLWDRASEIKNPFTRLLAETGTGLLRGADAAAESILPGPAMLVPGSELNTSARNREAKSDWQKNQAMDVDRMKANTDKERADTESGESASTITRNNAEAKNFGSEANARDNPPPQKTGLTPDDETFADLMHGDHGAPRINPDTREPYTTIEANRAVKQLSSEGKRFTDPFEAYAYGTPAEKKAAQDFITFDKQTTAHNEKPSEIEERYKLYKRDPQAYMDMYGSHNSAQDSRDQAQASRMLKYFGDQRKTIEQNYTLDDDEKQKQLEQIDELEQPYLNIAQPQPGAAGTPQGGTPQTGARGGGRGNAPQYQVGDTVTYKGQQMRISGVRKDGKLELQPATGGAR